MNENTKITTVNELSKRVYLIRNKQVMLDSDLAEIYGYEVKRLNEQVKRNINRFPEDFMFQLTRSEVDFVKSHFATSRNNMFSGQEGGKRKLPYAFTEQGVYMLATVLNGEIAEQQSIFIMRAFREMRHYIQENRQLVSKTDVDRLAQHVILLTDRQNEMAATLENVQDKVEVLSQSFTSENEKKEWVFLVGQKFEADLAYIEIYSKAMKSIYIIDDYVSVKTLDLLRKKQEGVEVILFTENKCRANVKLTTTDVTDYAEGYPTLTIKPNPKSHDRYIIIDYGTEHERIYHSGTSSKDAGSKVCQIDEIEDRHLYHPVIEELLAQEDKEI